MPVLDAPVDSPIRSIAAELQRQLDTKRDLIADTRRVSFSLNGGDGQPTISPRDRMRLSIDMPGGSSAEAFGVTGHAHGQIAQRLDLPLKTYDRLLEQHPDLFTHLCNGLLAREPKKRMFRTLDGDVRAVLSNKYRPRDNWDLLEGAVLPELDAFPGRLVFKSCDLTETRMYVKVIFPDIEKPVTPRVGDVIRGGLIIQNSEVGVGKLGIYPYTDRLICTNGMVHTDFGKGTRHVGKRITSEEEAWEIYSDATLKLDDDAFFAKCRDTIRAVLNETLFDRIVAQMQDLAGMTIDGAPDEVIEVFAVRNKLTENEEGSMLGALIDEGDRSAWGYVNALTRTARDLEDADRQTELETLAGKLTSDSSWVASLAA